jgi:hypothetical protein
VYNYTFFATGIVQINNAFLQPRRGILSGFLNDRTLCGLFQDGLHIGRHIIPYPPQYLFVITGIALPIAPAGLGGLIGDGSWSQASVGDILVHLLLRLQLDFDVVLNGGSGESPGLYDYNFDLT